MSDLFEMKTEGEAKKLFEEKESQPEQPQPISLGRATTLSEVEPASLINELGWIRVKTETLPSQGMFYPEGSEITIRAAASSEIRHWSTIDEEDLLSMDDALNKIVERCCKIRLGKSLGTYKDLKEIDRFFIVFAIRELTFKKGENSLNVMFTCNNCGKNDEKSIVKEMLSYYVPIPELQARFDETQRCFHLKLKNGEELRLFLPSLGTMNFIKNYIKDKVQTKQDYDKAFLKWSPFLFPDWRVLNDALYTKTMQDSYAWGTDKISVIDWFVSQMQLTVKAELKNYCSVCGEEATAPISFRGGVKSLFLISDISGALL